MARPGAGALCVWGVWLAMLVAAVVFVLRFGSNVPTRDDWDMVPLFTGQQPITAEWLWSQHNEHRVPVPRLLMLALVRLTAIDFRVLMVGNALAMGAVAAVLLVTVSRLRGAYHLADIVFPVLLLHWGHAENQLWGWQLQYYVTTAIIGIALAAVVARSAQTAPVWADVGAGLCLIALPLCGGNGLVLVPPLAGWLLYAVWLARREDRRGWRGTVLAGGLAAGALALSALAMVGWEPVPWHPRSSSLGQTLRGTLQFLAAGLGPAARDTWPTSGAVALIVLGVTALRLVRVWRDHPRERRRAAGLLSYLGAMVLLGLAIGMGRANFEIRYVTLAAPAWCAVYAAWALYGASRSGGALRALVAVAVIAALWPNTQYGLAYARDLRSHLAGFERDLVGGAPPHQLIRRYGGYLAPHHDTVHDYLPMLRDARVGAYERLRSDPPFRAFPVDLQPVRVHGLRWKVDTATIVGSPPDRIWSFEEWPYIIFAMPADVREAGIRLTYRFRDPAGGLPYVGLAWKGLADPHYRWQSSYKYSPTGDRATWERGTWLRRRETATTITAWLPDPVGEIKLTLSDQPGATFQVIELAVLVPAD